MYVYIYIYLVLLQVLLVYYKLYTYTHTRIYIDIYGLIIGIVGLLHVFVAYTCKQMTHTYANTIVCVGFHILTVKEFI